MTLKQWSQTLYKHIDCVILLRMQALLCNASRNLVISIVTDACFLHFYPWAPMTTMKETNLCVNITHFAAWLNTTRAII